MLFFLGTEVPDPPGTWVGLAAFVTAVGAVILALLKGKRDADRQDREQHVRHLQQQLAEMSRRMEQSGELQKIVKRDEEELREALTALQTENQKILRAIQNLSRKVGKMDRDDDERTPVPGS